MKDDQRAPTQGVSYTRPALFDPVVDLLVVALKRATGSSLASPAQLLGQHPLYRVGVEADAGDLLDHLGNPGRGPKGVVIPIGQSALQQGLLHLRQLLGAQRR